MQLSLRFILLLAVLPLVDLSKLCEEKPSLIQCVALRNRYIRPLKESCNPLRGDCGTGDLVDPRVANCHLQLSGNVFHSLVEGFKLSYGHRCFPDAPAANLHLRNVAPSHGEPRCVPINFNHRGSFVCGEHGTRCVCDAHPEENALGTNWLRHRCRCQFFVNLCRIPRVCAHQGRCKMWGSELRCECPADSEKCRLGINQCKANPGLCEEGGGVCLELYDNNVGWTMGTEKEGDGFACISKEIVETLTESTQYCDVSKTRFTRPGGIEPKNELDLCCYRMLTCSEETSIPKKGNVFSYRACYCNVEFRKCLIAVAYDMKYRTKAEAMIHVVNNVAHCQVDDGKRCDPTRPSKCKRGDLINPKIAHCIVDCKTGPLLPIWARACAIRQCKPPFHKPYLRIVDVPRNEESSICKPVEKLPVLCGYRDTNTRCVCDGKPSTSGFTDRCRCQFWPEG